ncbi:uncharacterized protein LOC112507526 isoform X2 [Cynara cardunculus var. scolymus]|uniref:uncharacterized protein LOC112507526 isoform X2 n=1 Tax=Cynara cardunculus var. scolymus TaxID=59895 RepID=UPI000D62FAF8|nr:uncharacterized protein LOC112507526 isoform X2 [Cynara cardunculus var. scolymus]
MAPLPYTQRTSSYFSALTQAIDKKLQRALASPTQRRDLLQQLFADVALEVDDRARDIILGREDAASMAELFEVQLDSSDLLLRYSSALVQGATNVFWIDIQTNTTHFQSLFRYLLEDVALVPERLKKIPFQAQRDLFLLLSRSIFLYNLVAKLESFFQHFPEFPNAFLVGGPADIFVIELTDQLQKLKVEPVLLHYLSRIRVLQGLELRMTTSTRLKTCLYSFTSPGGPMYPTRAVRHAAWDALDFLFPVGQYPRHIISFFFRLLYPWYWPSSCWNFILSCIQAILYKILKLMFPSRKPRDPHHS